MGLSAVTYALAKKYTDETAHQFGGLKGAPCKVKSVSKENGRTTITLEWKNDEGDTRETSFYVDDGSSIWVSGKEYKVNDIIVYNDIIYACKVENSDTVFNESKWTPITGGGSVNGYFNPVDNLFYKESTYVTPIVGNENTIYISIDTNKIYRYNGTIFVGLGADSSGSESIFLTGVILADSWSNNTQTVEIDGINPSLNGVIGMLETATVTQLAAASESKLYIDSISNNSITFGCQTVPSIDIPFGIIIPGGGSGSSELTEVLNVTKAVGGINSGKHYDAGVSLETILRDMLSPVLYPTLTNPSASLSVPGTTLLEHGTVISKTFTCAFSQGSINPAYGTNGKRSGPAGTYSLNGGTPQAGNTFTETVTELNKTFQVNVTYAEGPQPKDSSGNNYSTPLPAGNVDSNTITYDFTYALWSNATDNTAIVKMDLVKQSAKQSVINFGACDEAHPEVFDIPTNWGLTAIKVKNDLTSTWDVCTEDFTSSSVTHKDAADTDVNYTRYTCNLGYDMGPRDIRVEWS